ncbi:hypothetical protein PMAC_001792 [Pneumocystis sp. 'macacae']|nr:hypothetical protein PMAC_001792 [Pneumocystis sp. 'macacae']
MKFEKKGHVIHKAKNSVNIRRAYEYSYQGKSEKNRKKNIYIAQLKKNYHRCLKEYEQENIGKKHWILGNNVVSSLDLDAERSLSPQANDKFQDKNNLLLKKKKQKRASRYSKEEKKANDIRLKKEALIMEKKYKEEEKQRRIGERWRKYKIMTQVTKKGQPKLNKRISLLLEKIKKIMEK